MSEYIEERSFADNILISQSNSFAGKMDERNVAIECRVPQIEVAENLREGRRFSLQSCFLCSEKDPNDPMMLLLA